MKTRTIFLIGIGALAAGALGLLAFRTDPVLVDLDTVARGPMQVSIDVDGKTRVVERYDVAAPITGIAQRSPVRIGDTVIKGETVVAVVEPAASGFLDTRSRVQAEAAVREAEAGLQLARSNMRQAEEELALAESDYNRARQLVERGVVTLTRLEESEKLLAVREAALTASISRLEVAKGTLDRVRAALIGPVGGAEPGGLSITAPVSGRVLSIDTVSERPVLVGQRLLSIGQPDYLEIVADVLSSDAVRLQVGNRAIVDRWGGDAELEAVISKIEPSAYTKVSALGIEEQRVDVILQLTTPPDQRAELGDGFSVYARIVEWQGDDVLQVPLSGLFRDGNSWAVFVVSGDQAHLRRIKIGRSNKTFAEVLDGLEQGDRVVLHPNDRIDDATKVAERNR